MNVTSAQTYLKKRFKSNHVFTKSNNSFKKKQKLCGGGGCQSLHMFYNVVRRSALIQSGGFVLFDSEVLSDTTDQTSLRIPLYSLQYILSGSDDFNLYMWKIPKDPDAGEIFSPSAPTAHCFVRLDVKVHT